jgi:hypothetical protein
MKTGLMAVVALFMLSGSALAAGGAPTDAQIAQFSKECLRNSGGNTTMCECKAEQAKKLVDESFMDVIIASMNGKALSHEQNVPYGIYISKSNAVCAPGM